MLERDDAAALEAVAGAPPAARMQTLLRAAGKLKSAEAASKAAAARPKPRGARSSWAARLGRLPRRAPRGRRRAREDARAIAASLAADAPAMLRAAPPIRDDRAVVLAAVGRTAPRSSSRRGACATTARLCWRPYAATGRRSRSACGCGATARSSARRQVLGGHRRRTAAASSRPGLGAATALPRSEDEAAAAGVARRGGRARRHRAVSRRDHTPRRPAAPREPLLSARTTRAPRPPRGARIRLQSRRPRTAREGRRRAGGRRLRSVRDARYGLDELRRGAAPPAAPRRAPRLAGRGGATGCARVLALPAEDLARLVRAAAAGANAAERLGPPRARCGPRVIESRGKQRACAAPRSRMTRRLPQTYRARWSRASRARRRARRRHHRPPRGRAYACGGRSGCAGDRRGRVAPIGHLRSRCDFEGVQFIDDGDSLDLKASRASSRSTTRANTPLLTLARLIASSKGPRSTAQGALLARCRAPGLAGGAGSSSRRACAASRW